MRRRQALAAGLALVVVPGAARAQAKRLPRIGLVANTLAPDDWKAGSFADGSPHAGQAIRQGLRDLGWIEGTNIDLVWRSANGRFETLPAIFRELVAMPVDILVALGPGVAPATQATRTIPIVMSASAGAVEIGLVASLGRPGGNVTGLSFDYPPELNGKRLELMKEVSPAIRRVAILTEAERPEISSTTRRAADALGLDLLVQKFRAPEGAAGAVAAAAANGADALLVAEGVWVNRRFVQSAIDETATRLKLPVMHATYEGTDPGGLLTYGIDTMAQYRRIPYFVDKILKGARPSDLPVEQPSRILFVINMRAAKAIGLEVPPQVRLRADRIVE